MIMESKPVEEHIPEKKEKICFCKKISMILRNAFKPVHTEEEQIVVTAHDEMYEDLNVEKYEIISTLDKETCSICGDFDGRIFDTKDREEGVNAPPFHKDCRCVDVPYNEHLTPGERIARDAQGKNYYVPSNMNYNQWKKSLIIDDDESK